ncbi:hypothetical protein BLNAU_18938 [Blattamonas nauphoetae]|uniref:Uncharacterized protein n=1 Tax=Blattamonas nauphoetae TaxID=2049346 RepID=A0ABQ9X2Z8_9EUKA|nr:hypothetical protein BLNAU_18938 [Blattamonas nauphoetae]
MVFHFDHLHSVISSSAHPDLIDSFIRRLIVSTAFSPFLFYHDRHLNLISTLSQSSSLLFSQLSEPLLDPTFPLHSLLSPRSFTDPASSFFRIVSTNSAFFRRFLEKHAERILEIAISTVVMTVRVVSDEPCEPHCLDFGRATKNWVLLLNAMAEVKIDLARTSADLSLLTSSLLTLLFLSTASISAELSTVAVSVFSSLFGLSVSHSEALLFTTPPTFPVSDAFTPRHSQVVGASDHMRGTPQSICAEAGCCVVLKSRSDLSEHKSLNFTRMLGLHFAGCLVNALHSATSLPRSYPFFSPELSGLSQQPSVWNDTYIPSALTALTTLANIELRLAYSLFDWGMDLSHADAERRDIVFVHLFPFLGIESQMQFRHGFGTYAGVRNSPKC